MIKQVYEKYKAFFAYAFFGVCTTIVNTVVYWLFADLFHFLVVPSTIIAWFFAVLFAYFTNRKWVFLSQASSKAEMLREILSFYSCRIATGVVDWLFMFVFVDILHFNDLIVKVAANFLVIILNYIASKVLIFKKRNVDKEIEAPSTKTDKTGMIYGAFLLFSSLIMSINAAAFPFSGRLLGIDSSVFAYVARVIVDGGMPYIDTFDHKGPILYLINALGLLISERFGLWLIEWFFILITSFFVYKIARLMNCNRITSCAVVILNLLTLTYYFEGGNLVEEYACAFLMLSLYVFLEFFKTSHTNALKLILCGASFAIVCLLRLNMVVLWGVMCIGVLVYCIRMGMSKNLIGFILWFLVGMALIFVPIIIWLWTRGALTSFIEDYLLFNLSYSSDPARSSLKNKIGALVYFSTGIPIAVVAPILVFFCFNKQKKIVDWLCLIALGLSLLSICISGQKYKHYGMILCPIVVYAVSRLFADIEAKLSFPSKADRWQRFGTALSILCAVLLLFSAPVITMATNILHMSTHHNPTIAEHQIAEIVKSNTSVDDKISVCGNRNIIYLLSERKSASKYSYQSPIASVDSKIKKEYLEDIKQLKPKVLVIYEDMFLYDDLLAIIEAGYEQIAVVGAAKVYQKIV